MPQYRISVSVLTAVAKRQAPGAVGVECTAQERLLRRLRPILCSEDFGKKGIEHHVGSNNRKGVEYRRSDAPSHGPGWRTLARGGIVRDTVSAGIPRF